MGRRSVVLIILDGWGIAKANPGNPIVTAQPPFWNRVVSAYPFAKLAASGRAVGLPQGQAGNSEAGHMNLGAGRRIDQDSIIISKSISNGTFFRNPAFIGALEHAKRNKSNIHLMGIISGDQSPHMDPDHLLALITLLKRSRIKRIFLHLFTDGRDSYYYEGKTFLENLVREHAPFAEVVTVMGRLYLDRKKNWKRTNDAYEAMVLGRGRAIPSAVDAVARAYARGETDEFIYPSVVVGTGTKPKGLIQNGDVVIFFNLRSDRARQLSKIFIQKQFEKQNPGSPKRKKVLKNIYFVAMTDFGPDLDGVITAYPSVDVRLTLPFCLAKKKQLYIAESEKFAHITYFFNGGYSHAVAGEERVMIPSNSVTSYKHTPAMRVPDITARITAKMKQYDFIAANFASPDMIGHTGDIGAAERAVRIVDSSLATIARQIDMHNGVLVITADHGNIEEMIDPHSKKVVTQHSMNPVPLVVYGRAFAKKQFIKTRHPSLADVAPTILSLFDVEKPSVMTGANLLQRAV